MIFKYVINQTPEICLAAVKQNGWALKYVKEQTPEICLAAVKQDWWALQYVKDQTPEMCLAAVKQDGEALQYVKEQTPEICLAALKTIEDHKKQVRLGSSLYLLNSILDSCKASKETKDELLRRFIS